MINRAFIVLLVLAAGLRSESIPQIVLRLQQEVKQLQSRAFPGAAPMTQRPAFANIDFRTGNVDFLGTGGRAVNIGVGSDGVNGGVWLNAAGGTKVLGSLRSDGRAGLLSLSNSAGSEILRAGQQGETSGGVIHVYNGSGKRITSLGGGAESGGGYWFSNPAGRGIGFLGASTTGNPRLSLIGADDNQVALLATDSKGAGMFELSNLAGKRVVTVGMFGGGGGGIAAYAPDGSSLLSLGPDDTDGQPILWMKGRGRLDVAEVFEAASGSSLPPGSVVSMSVEGKGIELSAEAYDAKVVGVIAGAGGLKPAVQLGTSASGTAEGTVALAGQVYVRVTGPIVTGDLLVASEQAGVAMRAADRSRAFGAVVGKALEPYKGTGEGLIRVLVMAR